MIAESQSGKTGISQEKERSVRTGWLLGLLGLFPSIVSVVICDLMDRTLEEAVQFIILQELAAYFDEYERFHGVRSRKSGGDVYVEIFLEFAGHRQMAEVQSVINEMKAGLERKIQNSHVSIVPTISPVA